MTNVMWKYLDKRSAAIAAIKDYQSMQYIIAHTDKEIEELENDAASIGSIPLEKPSKSTPNPTAHEDRIVNFMDRENVLKHRYQEAKEYMDWFEPAWNFLKEDERHVLGEFYWDDDEARGYSVLDKLCEEYSIERTSVYKKKNRALDKLTKLLYGEV